MLLLCFHIFCCSKHTTHSTWSVLSLSSPSAIWISRWTSCQLFSAWDRGFWRWFEFPHIWSQSGCFCVRRRNTACKCHAESDCWRYRTRGGRGRVDAISRESFGRAFPTKWGRYLQWRWALRKDMNDIFGMKQGRKFECNCETWIYFTIIAKVITPPHHLSKDWVGIDRVINVDV